MDDRRKLYLRNHFKSAPTSASLSLERNGSDGGSQELSGGSLTENGTLGQAEVIDFKAIYESMPVVRKPPRQTVRHRTQQMLRQASVLSADVQDLLDVATDPTYIHIEGRLTRKLRDAIDPAQLAPLPGPEDLWDTFLPELRTPTPPPPPPPPPPPRHRYYFVKGKVIRVTLQPIKPRPPPSADNDHTRQTRTDTGSGGGGDDFGRPVASRVSCDSSPAATPGSGGGSSSSSGTRFLVAPPPRAADSLGLIGRIRNRVGSTALRSGATPTAAVAAAAAIAVKQTRSSSRRAVAMPRCPLCARRACVQHAFEATEKLRRFIKKPASRELTYYSLYAA